MSILTTLELTICSSFHVSYSDVHKKKIYQFRSWISEVSLYANCQVPMGACDSQLFLPEKFQDRSSQTHIFSGRALLESCSFHRVYGIATCTHGFCFDAKKTQGNQTIATTAAARIFPCLGVKTQTAPCPLNLTLQTQILVTHLCGPHMRFHMWPLKGSFFLPVVYGDDCRGF